MVAGKRLHFLLIPLGNPFYNTPSTLSTPVFLLYFWQQSILSSVHPVYYIVVYCCMLYYYYEPYHTRHFPDQTASSFRWSSRPYCGTVKAARNCARATCAARGGQSHSKTFSLCQMLVNESPVCM